MPYLPKGFKQNSLPRARGLLSIGEASSFLGVSVDTLRNWEEKGKIATLRSPGGIRKFRLSDLKVLRQQDPRLLKKAGVSLPRPAEALSPSKGEGGPSPRRSGFVHAGGPITPTSGESEPTPEVTEEDRLPRTETESLVRGQPETEIWKPKTDFLTAVIASVVITTAIAGYAHRQDISKLVPDGINNLYQTAKNQVLGASHRLASPITPISPISPTSGYVLAAQTPGSFLEISVDTKITGALDISSLTVATNDFSATVGDTTYTYTLPTADATLVGTATKQTLTNKSITTPTITSPAVLTQTDSTFAFLVNDDGTADDATPFIIDSSGNVGIGTSSPGKKLDVAGDTKLGGTLDATGAVTFDSTLKVSGTTTLSGNATVSGDITLTGGDLLGPSGENIDLGEATADTIIFYIASTAELSLNATSLSPTTDSGLDIGSTTSQFGDLFLDGGNINLDNATDIDIDDNTASSLTITQGTNSYLDISTTDTTTSLTLDLPVAGSTSTTGNLFTAAVTKTVNISDSASTNTIDIGGVTASGTDTINIATNSTAADTIAIGNSNASTTLALTGGDDWSITTTGLITTADDAAINGGDITTTATTATLFNTTATTLSLGGAATTALNLGNGSGNYTAINLGSGAGTHTINIAGTGATGIDTINIGTGGTAADTINIGTAATANTIAIGSSSSNWSITAAGLITTAGDLALNGADITTTAATFNLVNEATTLNIGSTAVTRTINIGTGTNADTINIGTGATSADTLTFGNTAVATTFTFNTGASTQSPFSVAANALTTGDVLTLSATSATSGSLAVLTGPSAGTAGVTDAALKITSDVGNTGTTVGLISSTATVDSTAASASGVNLYLSTTNSPSTNTNSAYGLYSTISDATALANTVYGIYSTASTASQTSTGTYSTYSGYFTNTGTTTGTTTAYGIYATATGADTNWAAYFAGNITLSAGSDILAQGAGSDIGSAGTRFATGYFDEVNATTLTGTLSGGNLTANTFTINSDNATADTEDANLVYERGTTTPNAVLWWNSTDDVIQTNSALKLAGNVTNTPTFATTVPIFLIETYTNHTTGDLVDITATYAPTTGPTVSAIDINITNSPTTSADTLRVFDVGLTDAGTLANTVYGLYVDVTTSNASDTTYAAYFAGGNVGIGDTTPAALLTVGSGDLFQVSSTGGAVTIAGVADGTDALTLTAGDILVSNGDLDLSGGDFNVTLDSGDGVTITGTQPASVGSTPATDATAIIGISAATGGNTTIGTTGTGGIGSGISWTLGTGGTAASANTASTGGAGGAYSITSGTGGAAAATGTNVGGAGGAVSLTGGTGGAASLGTSNTGGAGGALTILAGAAGSGGNANGGTLTLNSGAVTGTGTSTLNIGTTNSTVINIGDSTVTKTIDIGGVTSSDASTINIATESTAADVITIGNTNASTTIALTGGDDWSMAATGILTMSASAAATTAILITDADYTNSLSIADNSIIGTTAAIDFTNFDVSSTGGAVTIAGVAEGTASLTQTAGDHVITDGDLTLSGGEISATADDATGTNFSFTTGALSTGTGLGVTSTSNAYTSGSVLSASLTQSAATGTSVSGDVASLAFSPTYSTAVTTPTISGNVLDISRTSTTNSLFASTLTVSGALVSISDTSTQTTGTLTSTADVVAITQNYTSNSGAALNVTTAGTGFALRVNDDGTLTDSTPFVVDSGGNVGVGTTAPSQTLHVVGQCVAAGTRIRRKRKGKRGKGEEEWEDVPVEDIEPGDEVLSLNDQTGEFEWHKVEKTMDMGMQEVFRLTTESGKWIETTSNHPYLILLFNKDESNNSQKQSDHHDTKGFGSPNIDIFNVNFPGFSSTHNSPANFLTTTEPTKVIIPEPILMSNTQSLSFGLLEPIGITNAAPNQPAERLVRTSDNVVSQSGSTFTQNSIPQSKWTKVSQLKEGQMIATTDGWEKIVSINKIGRTKTYDLQIEGTHNFVGNEIVAHNTFINSSTDTGLALNIDANSLTTGSGLDISSTATAFNGELLVLSKTGASGSTAFTSDIAGITYSQTFNGGVGLDSTGNVLDISRAITLDNATNTHTISGAGVTIADSGTQTAGTLTWTGDTMRIAQNYTGANAAALNITTASTDAGTSNFALRVNDDGTFTDSTPFVVDETGNVGIGTTAPGFLLEVGGTARINGAFTMGDAAADTITFTGSVNSNINFLDASSTTNYSIIGSDATAGTTTGGALTIQGGAGFGNPGAGGAVNITGGTAPTGGAGGAVVITAGTPAGFTGGAITLQAGNGATGTSRGGAISLTSGAGNSEERGGHITVTSGAGGGGTTGGATTASGDITITSGSGGSTAGNSGTLTLDTGAVTSGTVGAINIGTSLRARTITIGNATGATALALTSGTGAQTFTSSVATGTTTSSAFVFTDSALTSGTGLYLTGSNTTGLAADIDANSLTTGSGLDISSTATAFNGELLVLSKTGASGSTAFTSDIAGITYSQTFNGGVGLDSTGNVLDISRAITLDNATNTHTISGAGVTIADSGTQTAGTLTWTGDTMRIAQNYTGANAAALNITTASTDAGTSNFALRVNDDGTFTDSTPFVVDEGGNVGIGTTSPAPSGLTRELTVSGGTSGDVTAGLNLQGSRTIDGTFSAIGFYHQANQVARIIGVRDGANDAAALTFNTQPTTGSLTERVRITSGGNVGIGDTTPDALFDIDSAATTTNVSGITATAITSGNVFDVTSSSTAATSSDLIQGDHTATYTAATTVSGNLLDLSRSLTASGVITLTVDSPVVTISDACAVAAGGTCTYNATADVVRINQTYSAANSAALNITTASTDAGTSNFALRVNDDGTFTDSTPFVVDETGNVGIGTTGPAAKLHILGGNRTTLILDRAAAQSNRFKMFVGDGTGGYVVDENYIESLNTGLHFMAGASGTTEVMTILLGGNVGIGTTSPTSKLQIVGGNCADDAGGGGCTADYAEIYPSSEDVEKGDVLIIDETSPTYAVKRSSTPAQKTIIGIVSTAPAMIIEGSQQQFLNNEYKLDPRNPAVALSGRVPVKVSTENGPIEPGDYLTSSSMPGVAMRATKPGAVVGKALEEFSCQGESGKGKGLSDNNLSPSPFTLHPCEGSILVFVNVSFADPENSLLLLALGPDGGLATTNDTQATSLPSSDPLTSLASPQAAEGGPSLTLESRVADLEEKVAAITSDGGQIDSSEVNLLSERLASLEEKIAILLDSGSVLGEATASASLSNSVTQLLSNLTVEDSLTVLGTTNLADTAITGNLTVGLLSIQSLLSDPTPGVSLNALGLLKLQSAFGGGVEIDQKGNVRVTGDIRVEGEITADKFQVNAEAASPSVGTGKVLAATDEVFVATSQTSPTSQIIVTFKGNYGPANRYWVDEIVAGEGFTLKLNRNLDNDAEFSWWIVN